MRILILSQHSFVYYNLYTFWMKVTIHSVVFCMPQFCALVLIQLKKLYLGLFKINNFTRFFWIVVIVYLIRYINFRFWLIMSTTWIEHMNLPKDVMSPLCGASWPKLSCSRVLSRKQLILSLRQMTHQLTLMLWKLLTKQVQLIEVEANISAVDPSIYCFHRMPSEMFVNDLWC